MVRMSDDVYQQAKSDLIDLVSWMGHISAAGEGYEPPECSDPDNCKACKLVDETFDFEQSNQELDQA
jgi:hypothetical protein